MKKLTPILIAAIIALSAFSAYQHQRAEHAGALVAQMKKDAVGAREETDASAVEVRQLKEQTRSQKVAIDQLEARNKELANAAPGETAKSAEPSAPGVPGREGGGDFMKGFAKMFNDPKMKDAMRAQQAAGVNLIYGDLARELGLAPDEARQVLALLADRQMDIAGRSMAAMSKSGGDAAALATVGKDTESVKAGYDEQLKAVLGEEKYAKFQDYEKSAGERFALDQVQKQFSASGTPLEPTQSQGLLAIMKEERARTPSNPSDPAAQLKMIQSDAGVDGWMKTQEDFNRRVLDRARTVLSPDQILTFEAAQKQQIEMQRMGLQMSREMFKGKK